MVTRQSQKKSVTPLALLGNGGSRASWALAWGCSRFARQVPSVGAIVCFRMRLSASSTAPVFASRRRSAHCNSTGHRSPFHNHHIRGRKMHQLPLGSCTMASVTTSSKSRTATTNFDAIVCLTNSRRTTSALMDNDPRTSSQWENDNGASHTSWARCTIGQSSSSNKASNARPTARIADEHPQQAYKSTNYNQDRACGFEDEHGSKKKNRAPCISTNLE